MPDRTPTRRPTALVIGASAAGLFTAAALAGSADVTIVERDVLPAGAAPRRGVPQARHAHLVWSGGVLAFDALLPGVVDDVVARGGRLVRIMGDMVSRAPNEVWFRRFLATHHRNLASSRDLLDAVLRDRVLAHPRTALRQGTTALGLEGDARRVTGLRVRDATGERTLTADLVVDASGRGSRTPHWLRSLGLPRVTERRVDAGITYATRVYRAPGTTAAAGFPLVNVQANPSEAPGRGGIVLPVEGGRWIVTLAGTRGGEPTSDPRAFVEFARRLADPVIGALIENADAVGGVTVTRGTANQRRHYEKMRRWPDGFLAIGDAVAGYNPVYGHGLTVAAQSAVAVRGLLRTTGMTAPGSGRLLQRAAARPVSAAWNLAVGQDAFYPGATDTPPSLPQRLLARYVDRAVATGARSPRALGALLDVMSLEKPATRLFAPDMLLPMLLGPKKKHLSGPPLTEAEWEAARP